MQRYFLLYIIYVQADWEASKLYTFINIVPNETTQVQMTKIDVELWIKVS